MKIRDYIPEKDYEQVKKLAEKYKLNIPKDGKIIIVENNNGEIKSFVNLRLVLYAEPFVSESPIYGKELWDYIEKKIEEKGIKIIRCFTKGKNLELFKKLGFYEAFGDQTALEKNFYSEV